MKLAGRDQEPIAQPAIGHDPEYLQIHTAVAAALATPYWACLALGHPVLAGACMMVALVGFLIAFMRKTPAEPGALKQGVDDLNWETTQRARCLMSLPE